jgi:hypothetical protein
LDQKLLSRRLDMNAQEFHMLRDSGVKLEEERKYSRRFGGICSLDKAALSSETLVGYVGLRRNKNRRTTITHEL